MQAVAAKVTFRAENVCLYSYICACCLCCYGAAFNRSRIRKQDDIGGYCILEVLLYVFCGVCAVTQEWQHVMKKKKGDSSKTMCDLNEG
jgi:hypothetical protein